MKKKDQREKEKRENVQNVKKILIRTSREPSKVLNLSTFKFLYPI